MKAKHLISGLCLSLLFIACKNENNTPRLEPEELAKQLKEVLVSLYKAEEAGNTLAPGDLKGKLIRLYDDSQQLKEDQAYDAQEQLNMKRTYIYNEQGKLSEENVYNATNLEIPHIKYTYTYDSEGRLQEKKEFNEEGL